MSNIREAIISNDVNDVNDVKQAFSQGDQVINNATNNLGNSSYKDDTLAFAIERGASQEVINLLLEKGDE